jgi:PEGA domain
MKGILKSMNVLNAVFLLLLIADLSAASDLIEPSRGLPNAANAPGNLAVLSEPPQLDVTLDSTRIGKTPVFLRNVKSGTYQLRVKDSETTIYVEPGATLKISLFKGEFINIPVAEKEPVEPQALQEEKVSETRITQQAPKEEQKKELSPWDRFVNKSINHF